MKICKFIYQNKKYFGALKNGLIFPIPDQEIVGADEKLSVLRESISISGVSFLPPVTPTKIVCVGRNYAEHAAELGNEVPKEPLLFLKAPSSLIIDGERIVIPKQSIQVEHEAELAVIISQKCQNLSTEANSFDYVFGYTCLNDVTARDLQRKDVQFTRAKSFDTFCPIGNFIETDVDVSDLKVVCKVNGIEKQSGRTSQMVFSVGFLIRYISNQMTLNPGDIIATGTPSGVSKLDDGDLCEIEIEGIGNLTNKVIKLK